MKSRYGKRIVAAALVACMAFSLAGCGGKRKINDGTFRPVDEAELAFPLKEKADITGMISYPANTESEPNKRTIFKRLQEATNVEVKWTAIQSDQWADKISLNMSDPNKLTDFIFSADFTDSNLLKYAEYGSAQICPFTSVHIIRYSGYLSNTDFRFGI